MLNLKRFFQKPTQISQDDYHARLLAKGLTEEGLIPDPVPMAPPIGYKKQPSMVEVVRSMVRSERLALEAELAGYETFEESEDFDVDDDDMPRSPHEFEEDQPSIAEMRAAVAEARKSNKKPKEGGDGGQPPAGVPLPPAAPGAHG